MFLPLADRIAPRQKYRLREPGKETVMFAAFEEQNSATSRKNPARKYLRPELYS
jgi:hypothetical protein